MFTIYEVSLAERAGRLWSQGAHSKRPGCAAPLSLPFVLVALRLTSCPAKNAMPGLLKAKAEHFPPAGTSALAPLQYKASVSPTPGVDMQFVAVTAGRPQERLSLREELPV